MVGGFSVERRQRMDRETRILESLSDMQKRAYELISREPGLIISDLAKRLGCAHSTATYHLRVLVEARLVVGRRDGRVVRQYAAHHANNDAVHMKAAMAQQRVRRVLRFIEENATESISINEMATRLGIPFNSLKPVLETMKNLKWISLEKRGGRYRGVQKLPAFDRAWAALKDREPLVSCGEERQDAVEQPTNPITA